MNCGSVQTTYHPVIMLGAGVRVMRGVEEYQGQGVTLVTVGRQAGDAVLIWNTGIVRLTV